MSSVSLEDKTALVTGASAGIGRETANAFAKAGANVVLAARREEPLKSLADSIKERHDVKAVAIPTDVTDELAVEAVFKAAIDRFETLDIVINNAGTGTARSVDVEDLDTAQYRTVMNVNTDGMFFVTRAALPHLRATSGTIVFIGSFAGKHPRPESPIYAATKWWTRGFALSLAGQVGTEDVGVTIVNPTEVRTEFGKEFRSQDELSKERYGPNAITEPSEVAEAVVFAVQQESPSAVTELDLYRRDKFSEF